MVEGSSTELEEEVIQMADNRPDDNQLDDVIPCELVAFEDSFEGVSEMNEVWHDMTDSPSNSLYNEMTSFTPSVSLDQMVDIAPQVVANPNLELEEESIPQEDNSDNDNQLDDVM